MKLSIWSKFLFSVKFHRISEDRVVNNLSTAEDYGYKPTTTMDLGGGYSKPTLVQKARRIYGRLTFKGKVFFGILSLLILYMIFPSWRSSSSKDPQLEHDLRYFENYSNSASTTISSKQLNSLSDLLNYSPHVSKVDLKYMSLPPLLDSNNKFPHYRNGGNMLLSRNSDHVRLVRDSARQTGYLFSDMTISNDDLSAFEIDVGFKIHGQQDRANMIGDGMAIWLTTEQLKGGDVFGIQSNFNGLGLFLDTYKNYNGKHNRHAFPYLSIQRNKGYDGYYDKGKDGINTQIGGCSLHKIYNTGSDKPTKLKITYVRQAGVFEVLLDEKGQGEWRTCYRKENVDLDGLFPVGRPLYLGVSAETGELHHNVDLYSIDVKTFRKTDGEQIAEIDSLAQGLTIVDSIDDTDQNQQNAERGESLQSRRRKNRKSLNRLRRQEKVLKQRDREKYQSEHGFVGWFFSIVWSIIKIIFYIVLLLVAAYAGVIAFRVYRENQRKKNIGGIL